MYGSRATKFRFYCENISQWLYGPLCPWINIYTIPIMIGKNQEPLNSNKVWPQTATRCDHKLKTVYNHKTSKTLIGTNACPQVKMHTRWRITIKNSRFSNERRIWHQKNKSKQQKSCIVGCAHKMEIKIDIPSNGVNVNALLDPSFTWKSTKFYWTTLKKKTVA